MIRSKVKAAVLAGAFVALGMTFVGASPVSAQEGCTGYGCTPPDGSSTTTTPDDIPTITVVRGETIDVSGEGCAPGAEVVVTWDDGSVLGTFTADENGDFTTTITIPSDATLGVHLVTATCGDVEQFINVNVLAETVDNVDDGTLPRTGSSNTGPLVGIGAAAVVLGGAFLYGARRPRQA
ncbi:LPXTG cell wall anchor domain-containing protein [Aquihabitans daechungensis]|uniref:LPXTG cell wall anchor domain-containing protein n=1 Tax=Aquihabitans daechungensis TaxID=1052257 RepID=UPI003BA38959